MIFIVSFWLQHQAIQPDKYQIAHNPQTMGHKFKESLKLKHLIQSENSFHFLTFHDNTDQKFK